MEKEFWKCREKVKAVDEHRNAITLSAMERWKKKVDLKEPMKELSQFDNKKREELESEFDHFLIWIIRIQVRLSKTIVDLDFVYKQLLDRHKAYKTTLSLT